MNKQISVREVDVKDKKIFNSLALHPLQSWEWGQFRQKTGIQVIRLGLYENDKLIETAQLTIHPIPFTQSTVGYLPKGSIPSEQMLTALYNTGIQNRCIFIKLEPNIITNANIKMKKAKFDIRLSPHSLFTKYTFQLDLTKSEDELLKNMHHKTRYNIKVAQKNGVVVVEDNSDAAFSKYLELTKQTTRRQKFFAHTLEYHRLMWETLKPCGMAHLLTATYKYDNKPLTLVTWILFLFNNVLYYPYGASSDKFRNTMASNLMMWEAIRFGKRNGAKTFDLWGCLGPNPNPKDPWYGFHRFKMGYNPELVEFGGSFDLVINPRFYRLYNLTHSLRQVYLNLKSRLPSRN